MQVTVISATIQEFQDRRYYSCGRYFQRKGKRLHRAVWEALNGPIPSGFHVHHLDHNTANNQPNNLGLLRDASHLSHHSVSAENMSRMPAFQQAGVAAAPDWHRSDAGRAWHREHGKEGWIDRPLFVKQCEQCGGEYETPFPTRSKFCHPNCRQEALRRRRGAHPKIARPEVIGG